LLAGQIWRFLFLQDVISFERKPDKSHVLFTALSCTGGSCPGSFALQKFFMEVQKRSSPYEMTADEEQQFDAGFRPKGAMAFFILLVILGIIIWYGIYLIMAARI
jgi:hypothetical protein